jgi:beta-lactamase superfamily II metal-dependent hydrolase
VFSLHVIQAEFGDCLLLEYGTAGAPHFILVDGGPPQIFNDHLREVLREKVVSRGAKLDRVILSHVDNDHIVGLIDLFTELQLQKVNSQPGLVAIEGLWHNSFGRTIDVNGDLQPRLQTLLAVARTETTMGRTAISVNGIAEGNKLRQLAQLLQIPINTDLSDPITVNTATMPVNFENLRLTVVGPSEENLAALRLEWNEWLDRHENAIASLNAMVMANADRSVPNLSSICLVAEADGRTILLTGDARSDQLYDNLLARGLLDSRGSAHFDVFKVAHHGSDRNVTKTFFRNVTADRYVISANGKYGNPDLATLIWLVEAAKEQDRSPEVIVTNETPATQKLIQEYPQADYGYLLRFLAKGDSSIEVQLV